MVVVVILVVLLKSGFVESMDLATAKRVGRCENETRIRVGFRELMYIIRINRMSEIITATLRIYENDLINNNDKVGIKIIIKYYY